MKHGLMVLALVAALFVPPAIAQEWSTEQLEVWKVVESTWDADQEKVNWCAEVCHPNVLAWGTEYPAPRNREQIIAWWKRTSETSTVLETQVTPLGIIVQGDTAISHYYYSTMSEDKDGKQETQHGRYTDVLVKEDGKWLYIAWNGGEQDD